MERDRNHRRAASPQAVPSPRRRLNSIVNDEEPLLPPIVVDKPPQEIIPTVIVTTPAIPPQHPKPSPPGDDIEARAMVQDEDQLPRRSSRVRRTPAHFKDFVMK